MRTIGIENECTAFNNKGITVWPPPIKVVASCYPELALYPPPQENVLVQELNWDGGNFWTTNGARIYRDVGVVQEYASPECETLRELVLVDKAGDVIMKRIFEAAELDQNKLYLMKRTAAAGMDHGNHNYQTWGAHESYLVSTGFFQEIVARGASSPKFLALERHLVSRIVVTGAGHFESWEDNPIVFWVSPRAHFLHRRIDISTRGNVRPIINARNESLVNESYRMQWSRLHLICGDMNRSDWSLYLKMGPTLLIILCLEMMSSHEVDKLLDYIGLNDNPLEIMRIGSQPFVGNIEMDVFSKFWSAQMKFCEVVAKNSERLTSQFPEAPRIIEHWWGALDDLRVIMTEGGVRPASYRLDWLIKKRWAEERMGVPIKHIHRLRKNDARSILNLDMSYHRLNTRDFYRHLVNVGYAEEMFNMEEAEHYVTNPPKGRAENRVRLGFYLRDKGLVDYVSQFYWDRVVLTAKGRSPRVIELDGKSFAMLKLEVDKFKRSLRV